MSIGLRVFFFRRCCFPHLFTICLHKLFSIDICQMVTFIHLPFPPNIFCLLTNLSCVSSTIFFFFFFSSVDFIFFSFFFGVKFYLFVCRSKHVCLQCTAVCYCVSLAMCLRVHSLIRSFRLVCLFNIRFALLIAMYCTNMAICQNGYNIQMYIYLFIFKTAEPKTTGKMP